MGVVSSVVGARVVINGIVVVGSADTMGIIVLGISILAGISSGVSDEVVIIVSGGISEGVGSLVIVGAIVIGIADSAGIVSCVDSGVGAGVVSSVIGARVRASVQVLVWEPSSSVLPIVWALFQVLVQELPNLASLLVRVSVQGSVPV